MYCFYGNWVLLYQFLINVPFSVLFAILGVKLFMISNILGNYSTLGILTFEENKLPKNVDLQENIIPNAAVSAEASTNWYNLHDLSYKCTFYDAIQIT